MEPSVVPQLLLSALEGLRHFQRGEEFEHGDSEECEDEGEGEPRAGEEAEHGEECEDESEGEPWEPM